MSQNRNIPFGKPWMTESEHKAVLEVMKGDILTHGPQGHAFEEEFAAFMGKEAYCVSVSSCMAALHLSYFQLGIGPGDEVIVPAQTHTATAHAVEIVGARSVFVDCDLKTGNIDPGKLEALITPRTKAIGLVHFIGIPCKMDAILAVAHKHGLKVIEDCALAVGARYRGTHVGLFGDAGCFSFYPVKHFTTGEGGMFVTRHKDLAEKVAKTRGFGVDRSASTRPGIYDVTTLGLNYRMSDINAALGRVQLGKIGQILEHRRTNFTRLKSQLSDIENVSVLDAQDDATSSSHYCLIALLAGDLKPHRDDLNRRLKEAGIGTSIYYPQPVPRMTYYREKYGYNTNDYPNATAISDHSIALSVGPHVTESDIDYMAETVKLAIKEITP